LFHFSAVLEGLFPTLAGAVSGAHYEYQAAAQALGEAQEEAMRYEMEELPAERRRRPRRLRALGRRLAVGFISLTRFGLRLDLSLAVLGEGPAHVIGLLEFSEI